MCSNAGAPLDPDIAFQLALGNLDPFSLKCLDQWHPDHHNPKLIGGKTNGWNQCSIAPHKSIWSKGYSEHRKEIKVANIRDHMSAITIPTTRTLSTKLLHPKCEDSEDKELTIEALSSIYCAKQPVKKHIIVAETQDFESQDVSNLISKNPFSVNHSKRCSISPDTPIDRLSSGDSASKKRCLSPDKEHCSSSPGTSPIIESKNKNHQRMVQSRAFQKLTRFSKFQRTSLDDNNLVQSKFFNSFNSNIEPVTIKEASSLNVSGIAALNVDDCDVLNTCENRMKDDSVHNKQITLEDFSWTLSDNTVHAPIISIDLSPEGESTKRINPFKKHTLSIKTNSEDYNDNTYPLENLVTPVSSQVFTENMEGLVPRSQDLIFTKPSMTSSSQPILRASNINQSKQQNKSCRRPGLQRKNSAPVLSAQQSLLTNFGFSKKSQLKH